MPSIFINKSKEELPDRRKFDFYPTPYELCLATMQVCCGELWLLENHYSDKIVALDPGAGTGVWGRALKKFFPEAEIHAIEIQNLPKNDNYTGWIRGDFLDDAVQEHLDFYMATKNERINLIIGNPPYKYAEEFIRKGLEIIPDEGYLIFLLRIDFLGSIKRGEGLFKDYPPNKVIVSSRRPSFTGDRKTAGDNYCVGVWKGRPELPTILDWFTWEYEDDRDI